MRGYIARLLLRQGHNVSPVCNGREARSHLVPGAFEILLTQDRMAQVDGPELARRAGAAVPGLRTLFLQGFSVLPLKEGARPVLDEEVSGSPVPSQPAGYRDRQSSGGVIPAKSSIRRVPS